MDIDLLTCQREKSMACLLLKNLRFCQDGQFSALWNVNDSTVQMTTPDMLIGFQAQFITLSGVYTMEMNRFDFIHPLQKLGS